MIGTWVTIVWALPLLSRSRRISALLRHVQISSLLVPWSCVIGVYRHVHPSVILAPDGIFRLSGSDFQVSSAVPSNGTGGSFLVERDFGYYLTGSNNCVLFCTGLGSVHRPVQISNFLIPCLMVPEKMVKTAKRYGMLYGKPTANSETFSPPLRNGRLYFMSSHKSSLQAPVMGVVSG